MEIHLKISANNHVALLTPSPIPPVSFRVNVEAPMRPRGLPDVPPASFSNCRPHCPFFIHCSKLCLTRPSLMLCPVHGTHNTPPHNHLTHFFELAPSQLLCLSEKVLSSKQISSSILIHGDPLLLSSGHLCLCFLQNTFLNL